MGQIELTEREHALLHGLAAGFTPAQIARQLRRAPATIYPAVRTLLTKLGAATEAHAVARAYQTGLLKLPPPPTPRQLDHPAIIAQRRRELDDALNRRAR